jgi:hypothetical protein
MNSSYITESLMTKYSHSDNYKMCQTLRPGVTLIRTRDPVVLEICVNFKSSVAVFRMDTENRDVERPLTFKAAWCLSLPFESTCLYTRKGIFPRRTKNMQEGVCRQ